LNVVSYAPDVAGNSADSVAPTTTTAPAGSTRASKTRSRSEPPRKEENVAAVPAAFNLVTNMSRLPPYDRSYAPGVVGNSGENVSPAATRPPDASTATAVATS
jgi:hypothetical protein